MPFTITVTEYPTNGDASPPDSTALPNPRIIDSRLHTRYVQTVDTLDLKRVIDAVNPSVRKRRKGAKEDKANG